MKRETVPEASRNDVGHIVVLHQKCSSNTGRCTRRGLGLRCADEAEEQEDFSDLLTPRSSG